MKKLASWTGAVLVLSVLIHLATIVYFPYVIMTFIQHHFTSKPGFEANTVYHEPPITADYREIVMPSPDLLYSGVAFNLDNKPLHITASVPNTYWSISFYDFATTNFYSVNDRQLPDHYLNLLLITEGMEYPDPGSAVVVTAPSSKGLGLIRMLIEDENRLGDYRAIQSRAKAVLLD